MLGCGGLEGTTTNANPRWDADGDGISNAVETEPANSRYHFDTTRVDQDPSLAVGTPGNGSLTGGLNYPERDEGTIEFRPNPCCGPGWDARYDNPDSNDWATLKLINVIEAVGRNRNWAYSPTDACSHYSIHFNWVPATNFDLLDMSKDGGGPWYHTYDGALRHDDHQNGLEVDVRYLRVDKADLPLDIADSRLDYDVVGTYDLLACFEATNKVDSVFVADSATLQFWGTNFAVKPGHTNHFHVRVRYP